MYVYVLNCVWVFVCWVKLLFVWWMWVLLLRKVRCLYGWIWLILFLFSNCFRFSCLLLRLIVIWLWWILNVILNCLLRVLLVWLSSNVIKLIMMLYKFVMSKLELVIVIRWIKLDMLCWKLMLMVWWWVLMLRLGRWCWLVSWLCVWCRW